MDIRISNVYKAYSVQPTKGIQPPKATPGVKSSDRLSLSTQASDFQTAMKAALNTPDIRSDVVDRVKGLIDAGTYHITAHEVATKIIQGIT